MVKYDRTSSLICQGDQSRPIPLLAPVITNTFPSIPFFMIFVSIKANFRNPLISDVADLVRCVAGLAAGLRIKRK